MAAKREGDSGTERGGGGSKIQVRRWDPGRGCSGGSGGARCHEEEDDGHSPGSQMFVFERLGLASQPGPGKLPGLQPNTPQVLLGKLPARQASRAATKHTLPFLVSVSKTVSVHYFVFGSVAWCN